MTALENLFFDVEGEPLLISGDSDADGNELPHSVAFGEAFDVLAVSRERSRSLGHVRGLLHWLSETTADHCLWLRGELAATLRPDVTDVDAVVLIDLAELSNGDAWLARNVFASDVRLPPGELSLTVVHLSDTERVAQERTRSARRCQNRVTRDSIQTGWLEVTL